MKRNRYDLHALLLLLVSLLVAPVPAQAQSSQKVFDRLKAKYESIDALKAEFDQTMESEYSSDQSTSRGVLYLQGDRYRVETPEQTFVTNGSVTWVYLPSENQVLINDYVEDETTFSISDFLLNYDDRYDVSNATTATIGGEKHWVLTLKPKRKDSFFREVTLSMRDRDAIITRLKVLDVNGTTMSFNLKNIQINPSLGQSTFSFKAPQNAEVVDLRS